MLGPLSAAAPRAFCARRRFGPGDQGLAYPEEFRDLMTAQIELVLELHGEFRSEVEELLLEFGGVGGHSAIVRQFGFQMGWNPELLVKLDVPHAELLQFIAQPAPGDAEPWRLGYVDGHPPKVGAGRPLRRNMPFKHAGNTHDRDDIDRPLCSNFYSPHSETNTELSFAMTRVGWVP